MAETPSISDAVQPGENMRKNSFLNYKSAALPAELCRRMKSYNVKTGAAESHSKFYSCWTFFVSR